MEVRPAYPAAVLQARIWDRFHDNYVQTPMQKIVADRLRPGDRRDPHGLQEARTLLDTAYGIAERSEEHTSELQSLMRISYAVFCLKKKRVHALRRTHTLLPQQSYLHPDIELNMHQCHPF